MNNNKAIISSRIRLARNLVSYSFPNKSTKEECNKVIDLVKDAIIKSNTVLKDEFEFYKISSLDEIDKQSMIEEHLISMDLSNNECGAVLIKKDKTVSIMINEEDHIRIQTLENGIELDKAWDIADKIDDILEESLNYAFHENLGYLTACPTNTGTGMRASVMVHLPALTELGYIDEVLKLSGQLGLAVRGMYGEGSDSSGCIYQMSNQLTLGRREQDTIENVMGMAKQIIDKELYARELLKNKLGIKLEDRIFRSLGILKNARTIGSKEAIKLLSTLKLGVEMGYINNITTGDIDKLMVDVQPGHQSKIYKSSDYTKRDVNRAIYLRKSLSI
jgi:protein arginine kinase